MGVWVRWFKEWRLEWVGEVELRGVSDSWADGVFGALVFDGAGGRLGAVGRVLEVQIRLNVRPGDADVLKLVPVHAGEAGVVLLQSIDDLDVVLGELGVQIRRRLLAYVQLHFIYWIVFSGWYSRRCSCRLLLATLAHKHVRKCYTVRVRYIIYFRALLLRTWLFRTILW